MATHALRTEINHLTSAISHHRKILDELETRRGVLQTQLAAIVYPILTLPPEITSEIFVHCLSFPEAPLVLTWVCAAWRRIAISTPALWTTIFVNIDSDSHVQDGLTEMTQTWLDRALFCPLFIRLSGESSDASKLEILSTLRRYTPRAERLELYLSEQLINEMDPQFSCSDFPLLRNLVLRLGNHYKPLSLHTATMFAQAPLLCSVRLFLAGPSAVALPWLQLTEFVGEQYFTHECLEALSLMPNLTTCRFDVIGSHGDSVQPLNHQNLRHLELIEDEARFFQHLTLPALHTLHWTLSFKTDTTTALHWRSFIQRSSPPLKQLTIKTQYGQVADFEFPGVFARLPLTDLEIWCPDLSFATSFLQLLGSDMSFLSQLTILRFMDCEDYDEGSLSDMVDMAGSALRERIVASSSTQCARLVEFRVHVAAGTSLQELTSLSEGSLPLLRELKDNGVVVHIGSLEQSIV